ncbi:NADH dehydrogenase [ubiquinone] 1 alpha subcomplex assembly factor 3 [Habropoda laboriosa]|uniref:NADH dehydrogenase [ubiquinone] 1 alpha subcomplex assembly factor 3 n=1 Tax=Habropoda laboriosa TaxID=597456 RepID=A0A0L7QT17_9HYME|nr:PREDICTED: NADH dehydrogenase [ubiquinone] 1 alpha subcomplex assembly factor 3 [Habropoda laboriosa]KOC61616.1 NADH dehydrogenase [ubiquinone] 1 alpha subcomplex assembly factor 3 [Habropoda laboriosa]
MLLDNKFFLVKRLLQNVRQFHSSGFRTGYEGPGKTTVNIINDTDEKLLIDRCLSIGFTMNNNSLTIGPIAIFPETVLSWNVGCTKDINEASLSLFTILKPTLDILILGLEIKCEYNEIRELKKILLKYNIKNEIFPVQQACGVYNFLVSEGRYVAAGLIPPIHSKILKPEKEINKELIQDKKLINST